MVENDAAANIPTLDEFLATVGPLNPDASNKDLIDAYQTHFGVTTPAPETRATLPSLEEFTQTLKPLNPGATDEDLRQAWQDKFGVLGAREKKPSFTESVGSGFEQGLLGLKEQAAGYRERAGTPGAPDKQFAKEAGDQLAEAAKKYNVPADLEEQSVWKKFTDPEYLGHVIGQQLSGNIPSIGGAIAGGLIGSAAGPPGAMAGATLGMGGATFLQRAGESYREAFQKNKEAGLSDDEAHEKAYTQSGIAGAVSGVINSLAVPLTLVRPFTGVLKNLLLQYAGNVAIDTADQASGNVIMGHPIEEGVPEAAMTSALFGAPETMAVMKSALHTAKPKETPPPQQTVQPTPPPSSTPPAPGEIRKDPLDVAKPITDPTVKTVDEVIDRAKKVTDDVPINIDELDKAVGRTVGEDVKKIKDDVEKVTRDAELKALDDKRKSDLQNDQLTLDTLRMHGTRLAGGRTSIVDPETLPDTAPESNPSGLTKSQYLALSDVLALDGTRLAIYRGTTKTNGFVAAELDQKTAWINADTTKDPAFIAFHEVQHLMQKTEIFDSFRDVVLQELKPRAYQAAELRHGGLSKERLFDEMMADLHGDAMTQESFHKKLIARLESESSPEAAQTKLTQFLSSLKEMIARVRDHLTGKLYTNDAGERIVRNYVNNLERVHDALAGALAEHYRVQGVSAELPMPSREGETITRGGKERVVVHPDAVRAFRAVATQRHGDARASSLRVLKSPGAATGTSVHLSNILHHLTAAAHEGHVNQGTLKDTIGKAVRALPGTRYEKIDTKELQNFREAHARLPVYNRPQWLAREAAIAFGEKRLADAQSRLNELNQLANQKDFAHQALSFKRGGDGKLAQHFNEVEGEMIIEKGAKEPKFRLPDGREVTQSEMLKTRQRVKPTKLSTRDEVTKQDVAKPKEIEYKKENVSSTTEPTEGVTTREEDEKGQGRKEGLLKKSEPAEKSAPSRSVDDIQKDIDTIEEQLDKSGVNVSHLYDLQDPTTKVLHGVGDWKPMPEKLAKLYRDRYAAEKHDKQDFTDAVIKESGLSRESALSALKTIYLTPENLTAHYDDTLKRWSRDTTNILGKLYNHFLAEKYGTLDENFEDKFATFRWGGTADQPKMTVNINRGGSPDADVLGKVESLYNAIAKHTDKSPIDLTKKGAPKQIEGTSLSLDDIPESLNVSIRALRESTGEMVMTKEDAKTALKDLDESLAKYQQLLKCVQS